MNKKFGIINYSSAQNNNLSSSNIRNIMVPLDLPQLGTLIWQSFSRLNFWVRHFLVLLGHHCPVRKQPHHCFFNSPNHWGPPLSPIHWFHLDSGHKPLRKRWRFAADTIKYRTLLLTANHELIRTLTCKLKCNYFYHNFHWHIFIQYKFLSFSNIL
jgi:hypothetical protein